MSVVIEEFIASERGHVWVSENDELLGIIAIPNGVPVAFLNPKGVVDKDAGRKMIEDISGKEGGYASGPLVRGTFPALTRGDLANTINLSVMETRARALIKQFSTKIEKIFVEFPQAPAPVSPDHVFKPRVAIGTGPTEPGSLLDQVRVEMAQTKRPPAGTVFAPPPACRFDPSAVATSSRPEPENVFGPDENLSQTALTVIEERVGTEMTVAGTVLVTCSPKKDVEDHVMLDLASICGHHENVEMLTSRSVKPGDKTKTSRKIHVRCPVGRVPDVLALLAANEIRSGIKVRIV